jgi:hypothetical protein
MTWLLRPVNKGLGFGPHTNDWGNIKNTFARLQKPVVVGSSSEGPPLQHVWEKHPQMTNMQETKAKGGLNFVHSKANLWDTLSSAILLDPCCHILRNLCQLFHSPFIHLVWHPSLFCAIFSWTLSFLW